MELPWKQQIRRELKRRDKVQMGNYRSLVESHTRLLEKQDEKLKELVKDEQACNHNVTQDISNWGSSQDPEKLREEIGMLLQRLDNIERVHEHLLAHVMEEKVKEAERMNQNNITAERYRQLKERLFQIRAQRARARVIPAMLASHKCTI
ncbi:Hypothetical predicted protein [Pelobates cultripes]|nr:Hypothetical predicted protein [Pelobates cultripes]